MLSFLPEITGFLPIILGVVAAVAAFLGYGAKQRAKGRHDADMKQRIKDHENASDIRNRVERDLPDRVREADGSGWRD